MYVSKYMASVYAIISQEGLTLDYTRIIVKSFIEWLK